MEIYSMVETTWIFQSSKLYRKRYVETTWIFRSAKLRQDRKYVGRKQKFIEIWSSTYRRNIDVTVIISNYKPTIGSSYIKLPKELDHRFDQERFDDDNECFKCYLVRYLHTADHHPGRVKKVDRDFARNFLSKLEIFTKLKKELYQRQCFLVMKTRKNIHSMCQKILSKETLIYY